jgi:amino acid transporter
MESKKLRANTLGLVGLVVLGAVFMSPALGVYGSWGPMASLVGLPTPLVFLAALVVTLPTAISYSLVNREMPNAGSAFTWVWEATSPTLGTWVGLMMIVYYTISVIVPMILFSLFFSAFLTFLGVGNTGLWTLFVGVVIATTLVVYLTYSGIQISARAATVLILVESSVVVALSLTIVISKIVNGGFTLAPFNPANVQGGFPIFWQAMILGILSFTGFDVISTVGEEAKAPRALLPRATLLAAIGVGVFWVVTSWAFSIAVPVSRVQALTASGLTPVTPIAQIYWGWGQIFVIITGMTAAAAVYVATVIGASRSIFAMARERTLFTALGKLNSRFMVPWNAMHVVFVCSLMGILIVTVILGNDIDAFVWWAGAVVFFALITYMATNLANLVYFTRYARPRFNWFLNGLIPIVGIILDGYMIYQGFFKSLWSAGFRTGQSVIWFSLVVLGASVAYVTYLRMTAPDRLVRRMSRD